MNILHLFRKKEVEEQLETYIKYQHSKYGVIRSTNFMGWLRKFIQISHVKDMRFATTDDVMWYKEWVNNKFASEYLRREAMKPINSFLRFNRRCDIIFQMNHLGRKPDYSAIAKVKELRRNRKTYSEIMKIFKQEGRKVHKTQISRWANKILK